MRQNQVKTEQSTVISGEDNIIFLLTASQRIQLRNL